MRKILIVLFVTLVCMPPSAFAQAFGIAMGESVASIKNSTEIRPGYYSVEVPSPHSEFESYVVRASDTHGACVVRGVGKDHINDRFGISVKRAFESLETILENNYGPFLKNDFLRGGALWDDSNEWVMAIRQNERVFQSVWDRDENSRLPSNIKSIILQVNATSSDSSWIALQYTYINIDACEEELSSAEASGL